MPISDFKPVKREVKFPGGSMELRAISLPDVATIIDSHERLINEIVFKVRSRLEDKNLDDDLMFSIMTDTLMEVITETPILASNIICLCADEPEALSTAMSFPVSVQAEALAAISDLTFSDLASVKKFIANVKTLIRGLLPSEPEALAAE